MEEEALKEKLLDEISHTFEEIYADCDEELMDLEEEKRDIELFLKKTFPEAIDALAAFRKEPTKDNLQTLESCADLLNMQYMRIDHIGSTVEHLVSSLAKLMDRLESYLKKVREKEETQIS
ncbi:MAG: hypothetical protein AABX70_04780 [Nanoarchaeota archaeon]